MGKASRRKILRKTTNPKPEIPERPDKFQWWLIAALCLAAFLAYAYSLSFDFVYDDDTQVLRNPWIRDWSQLGNFFFSDVWSFAGPAGTTNYYRPFHMVAHAVGYALSGLKPFGYHLINVLLHCANTLLLAFFAYRLTRDKLSSAAGGFIFAFYPAHAESVAWIAGVTDPLCALFYFGALHVYLSQHPSENRRTGILTSLLFLGALFSKEMAFTFPLVIMWLDICRTRKLRWKSYATLMVSFGVYFVFRLQAIPQFQLQNPHMDLSVVDRFLSSVVLMAEYLAKAFVPFNINAFHVFHPTTSALDPRFLLSSLVIAAFTFCAWLLRSDRRILFLFGFIPLSLIPVMNIAGIGENVFADRYLYIPSLGSCILIPLIVYKASRWKPVLSGVSGERVAGAFLVCLSLVFGFILWKNEFMWRDNLTLYTETMKRSPDSANIAANLGRYYFEKGQDKEAAYWISRAQDSLENSFIRNAGALCANYVRLSSISMRERRFADALKFLEKAYKVNPRNIAVLQNMATVFILMKDYAQARKWCEDALSANPRNEISYNNLAFIYLQEKDNDKAIENARKALEIFPEYADAHLNLARGYAAKGLVTEAVEAYLNAGRINPSLASVVDQELKGLQAPAQTGR